MNIFLYSFVIKETVIYFFYFLCYTCMYRKFSYIVSCAVTLHSVRIIATRLPYFTYDMRKSANNNNNAVVDIV